MVKPDYASPYPADDSPDQSLSGPLVAEANPDQSYGWIFKHGGPGYRIVPVERPNLDECGGYAILVTYDLETPGKVSWKAVEGGFMGNDPIAIPHHQWAWRVERVEHVG